MELSQLAGHDLGTHRHTITDDDAILYALAVGAHADELDLVYERQLRVLPTMACAIGLWAVEQAGELGAYDRTKSLHVGQRLVCRKPLTPGTVSMSGRVSGVYDKGRMTIVEIEVSADEFDAGYTIFLPGIGDWGGPPPPAPAPKTDVEPTWHSTVAVSPNAAVLYRLTGDKHPVHIDAATAEAMGLDGPILHGLATLGIAAYEAAHATGAHPADLQRAEVRLSAPVYPGSELVVSGSAAGTVGDSGLDLRVSVGAGIGAPDAVALSGSVAF